MTSLVKNAALLGITYSVSSLSVLSSSYLPENALVDNDKPYFHSAYSASNQWWQISFSKQVAISSYLIKTSANYIRRLTAWHVDASNDNVTWRTVHTVTGKDIGGNTAKFYPNSTVHCLHFRIIHDLNTESDNALHLTFFDCFGEISSSPSSSPTNKVKCYCNTGCKRCLISFQPFILKLKDIILTLNILIR
jgi:hypothetical protein